MKKILLVTLILLIVTPFINTKITSEGRIVDYRFYIKDVYYIESSNQYVIDSYIQLQDNKYYSWPIYTNQNTPIRYMNIIESRFYSVYLRVCSNPYTGETKYQEIIVKRSLKIRIPIRVKNIYGLPEHLKKIFINSKDI